MLSINLYTYILRNYINLEQFVSKYTKGVKINESEYIHKCPFCHQEGFYVTNEESSFGGAICYCFEFECDFQSKDIIDFYSKIKKINKYESIIELFNDLKKKHNSENLSDYDFMLNIVKSSDNYFVQKSLKYYNKNEKHKHKNDYIEYLLNNTHCDDVNLEIFDNPEYIYGLVKNEHEKGKWCDCSYLDYIHPKLRNNKEFWIKVNKYVNVWKYVSDELKRDQDFVLEIIDEIYYQYIDDELKNNREFMKMIKNTFDDDWNEF